MTQQKRGMHNRGCAIQFGSPSITLDMHHYQFILICSTSQQLLRGKPESLRKINMTFSCCLENNSPSFCLTNGGAKKALLITYLFPLYGASLFTCRDQEVQKRKRHKAIRGGYVHAKIWLECGYLKYTFVSAINLVFFI